MYVLDTGPLINLCHSGAADRILKAISGPVSIPPAVYGIAKQMHKFSNSDCRSVDSLLEARILRLEPLGSAMRPLFFELVAADFPDDLGDAEAAAICLANEHCRTLVSDDVKVRRIYSARFDRGSLFSTARLVKKFCEVDCESIVATMIARSAMKILPEDRR